MFELVRINKGSVKHKGTFFELNKVFNKKKKRNIEYINIYIQTYVKNTKYQNIKCKKIKIFIIIGIKTIQPDKKRNQLSKKRNF